MAMDERDPRVTLGRGRHRAAILGARASCLALLLLAGLGCADDVPKGQYGVTRVDILGAKRFDEDAIEACLATYPREQFGFTLGGTAAPKCGEPPFDATRLPVNLWTWPWTDWPLFSETAFARDRERIQRWYQARGYYDAKVIGTRLRRDAEEREIAVQISVKEGDPVLLVRMTLVGLEYLDPAFEQEIWQVMELELGEPFDEALYERSKRRALEVLHEASYAQATVEGTVTLDPKEKIARVELRFSPGMPCTFGDVMVQGQGEIPPVPVREAADIDPGEPFSLSALDDARQAIFGLGPFASVELQHHVRPDSPTVDVLIKVVPARLFRFGVGIGLTAGETTSQENDLSTIDSVAQWDVHLLGKIEHKNFLGGMRKLRVEDRPRLIFGDQFPGTPSPDLGNLLMVELRQPAFAEPRTTLVARARWDRGPDPYGEGFMRDDIVAGLGPERRFFQGTLRVSSTINIDLFLPLPDQAVPYPSTTNTYMHHTAQLDLRDDARNTHRGAFFAAGVQHGGLVVPGAWSYVRLTQDSRGYLPLPMGMVLAGRAKLGLMFVNSSSIHVPAPSGAETQTETERRRYLENLRDLGPLRHRLRGGGQNSVRGYAPNTLGDVEMINRRLISGGARQWELSLELRVPVTESLGAVAFADAGDVTRQDTFRFDHPQTSLGLGLRYRTLVGPLRLDMAVAPPALQVFGPDTRIRREVPESRLFGLNGALSFTIGEAF
jgi:outer membrane protein assembly factor BamA